MHVRSLGHRIGTAWGAAVSKSGTSLVVFGSKGSLTIARRTEHASKFKISARLSAHKPEVISLTALDSGRFLLVYTTDRGLLARDVNGAGHFGGSAHVLAAGHSISFISLPLVSVVSEASRTVVVWGVHQGKTERIKGAIEDQAGWSGAKLLYSARSLKAGPFFQQVVSDSQDRFLVSLQGSYTAVPAAVMWGVPQGSRQWEPVTPPQTTNDSTLAEQNGATLASVNGVITAAWQDASGALVISTWDGSTWTTPVRAIAGSQTSNGPAVIYPRFVSDGSRAAIVWGDESESPFGPLKATIRAGSGGSWSAPLTFPHSRNDPNSYQETFWFAPSGSLAGIWSDSNFPKLASPPTLYAGTVSGNAPSATALARTQNPESARSWFVLPRAAGLRTIVWADPKDREFSATLTPNGAIEQKQSFPACADPGVAASNPDASAHVVAVTPIGDSPGTSGPKCPALLLW
jgi:hypothetical protein